jgi:PLP dependent protein
MSLTTRSVDEWEHVVAANLRVITDRIFSSHDRVADSEEGPTAQIRPENRLVQIVAVSKGMPIEAIEGAYRCGLRLFGENYADELVGKAEHLVGVCPEIRWTFQGRLQSNKINRLRPFVSLWQTVDSLDRARALGSRAPGAAVFVQIDATGGSADRSGVPLAEAPEMVEAARSVGLSVQGLMTIAPLATHHVGSAAATFCAIREMADLLQLVDCSMGMSDDLEAAVRSGSTMVRVGSALFGRRD